MADILPCIVLVAEDDEVSANAVKQMLQRFGCSVHVAENGAQAVALCGVQKYDLILMDGQMPVMDGVEATLRIRALPGGSTTPIVGTSSQRSRLESIEGGMNDVLAKPFERQKIRALLEKWGCLETATVASGS
ncbi:MAG: response regulator [Acidobacteriota bacterium]